MVADIPFVAVDVPLVGDERHKNWAKIVRSVDPTKASGWAFEGEFIAAGGVQDVPAGSIVVVYGERGSRANPLAEARVYTANADATLSHHASAKGRAWARTLRDTVERLLEAPAPFGLEEPFVDHASDETLAAELRRRGWRVYPPEEDT